MYKKRGLPYDLGEIESNRHKALTGGNLCTKCSPEVVPLVNIFFDNCIEKCRGSHNYFYRKNVLDITRIMIELASHTCYYEFTSEISFDFFKKIIGELTSLLDEATSPKSSHPKTEKKIDCILDVVIKNYICMPYPVKPENPKAGMLFRTYEALWKVIHRINTEWDELVSRGFSKRIFSYYFKSFDYNRFLGKEKSEGEKLQLFIDILDGKMKIVPVWNIMAYTVVPKDSESSPILHEEYCEYSLK